MRIVALLSCAAALVAVAPAAAPAGAATKNVQLARAGIGTSRFGGYGRSYRSYPGYRTYPRYRSRGYGRGFFHGLFTGWFFSHFFGYGFGFGFPLWPFFLMLLLFWMFRPRRRRFY